MINDDDPTQSLPDKDLTTQPTATAILEPLREFESRLSQSVQQLRSTLESQIASLRDEMNTRFAEVNNRFAEAREEMNARFLENREEMNAHFRLVANKIEVMHNDNLNVRAGQRELLKRMGELESKPS